MDIQVEDTSKILTGGNDCQATVFNKDTEQVVTKNVENKNKNKPKEYLILNMILYKKELGFILSP
ncbi:uncharacterized protein LOC103510863 isoform X1 [Diaphorina citri]|uniref:Pre-mRNA-processing factor 19 n=1 Tax=Diaphorina citri TaxID=121845 RepID=A0A3Q0J0Y1_DIACI|nr:uncharacterized protein LOC103510863 isoform X1 [Diaphorina citri]